MLKLNYTENSFYLECLTQSLEAWVAQRVILSLRVSQSLRVEPMTASFLLPLDLPGVERLKAEVKFHDSEIIGLCNCDAEYLEVTLEGSWLSEGDDHAVGIFVTTMSYGVEFFLYKLWQESQVCASAVRE
ncbi:MAG: alr0857 family protein [Cuspidothrix sp.]